MLKKIMTLTALLLVFVALSAQAETFVDTFDSGVGPWSAFPDAFINVADSGGNPGAYGSMVSGFGPFRNNPMPRTFVAAEAVEWHGNYRQAGVTGLGVDVIVIGAYAEYDAPGSIFLYSGMGTADEADDQVVYGLTDLLPAVGDGWAVFDVAIDCNSATLPTGWFFYDPTPNNPAPVYDFDTLIQNVDMVGFQYCDMSDQTGLGLSNIGFDNFRVTREVGPVSTETISLDSIKALYR